jgi:hypothetical protein
MIIVRLIGGLGNQMFQYAVGRNLALKNNVPLKVDISDFETYKLHKYSLQYLRITEILATPKEVAAFKRYRRKNGRRWFWYNRLFADPTKYVSERSADFDSSILQLQPPVYLDGYWQNEKYFKEIAGTIRDEFIVKEPPTEKNKETAEQIRNTNAVSLHVRRADYVTNANTHAWHGVCGPEYYAKAVSTIARSVTNPHFFVFSDDMPWAKQNIIPADCPVTYVDQNDAATNYEDLRLMSLCKHNIVANSSFSWWGAWLNGNPDKVVIAPQKWFQAEKMAAADIVPDSWVTL